MKFYYFIVWNLLLSLVVNAQTIKLTTKVNISFAKYGEAKRLLYQRDDFIKGMSPFDRAARMKTDRKVSEEKFLTFISENILGWFDDEKDKIEKIFRKLRPEIEKYKLNIPETIHLIKTTGKVEGGSPYTRVNAIVLPQQVVDRDPEKLKHTIAHELLHIISRFNPHMRKSLYNIIGFSPCNEIDFPDELKPRKCTNPDAPHNCFYITVSYKGDPYPVVPILFSREEHYDVKKGGDFFHYVNLKLLAIEEQDGEWKPKYQDGKPLCLDVDQVKDFFEMVGRNTSYIIHPEEILAENFDLLINGYEDIPSPRIVRNLETLLAKKKTGRRR